MYAYRFAKKQEAPSDMHAERLIAAIPFRSWGRLRAPNGVCG